jgi:hypothetical protein
MIHFFFTLKSHIKNKKKKNRVGTPIHPRIVLRERRVDCDPARIERLRHPVHAVLRGHRDDRRRRRAQPGLGDVVEGPRIVIVREPVHTNVPDHQSSFNHHYKFG